MEPSPLQALVDATPPGGTLRLDPPGTTLEGPARITHPITIDGQGATIWARQGPVLVIASSGVVLRHLSVEVTSRHLPPSPGARTALRVESAAGEALQAEQVTLFGASEGIPGDGGPWETPRVAALGLLPPREGRVLRLRINLPVGARVRSGIGAVHVVPNRLEPGPQQITLHIDPLPPDTRLYGRITFETPPFNRQFLVTARVAEHPEQASFANDAVVWAGPQWERTEPWAAPWQASAAARWRRGWTELEELRPPEAPKEARADFGDPVAWDGSQRPGQADQ